MKPNSLKIAWTFWVRSAFWTPAAAEWWALPGNHRPDIFDGAVRGGLGNGHNGDRMGTPGVGRVDQAGIGVTAADKGENLGDVFGGDHFAGFFQRVPDFIKRERFLA